MTQQQERLSAFVDGELHHSNDATGVTNELVSNSENLEKWKRYHLIRDCLRKETSDDLSFDLSARVSKALENELPIVAPKRRFAEMPIVAGVIPLLKQSGQLAVAACVTAVMIFSYQSFNQTEDTPFLTAPPVAGPQGGLAPVSLQQTRPSARDDMAILLEKRRQINALIEDHQRQLKLKNTESLSTSDTDKKEDSSVGVSSTN